jgi:hypothetical protein
MDITGAEIRGHRIDFSVLEIAGESVQHLSIIPVGFIDYGDDRWQADYVMVKIHLGVGDNNQCVLDDHMCVGDFIRLHDSLVRFQNGVVGVERLATVDGALDLTVEWREGTGDVQFVGRIPAFEYSELEKEPLRLREGIYRVLSFQFAMVPCALARPIAQLARLLESLSSLKPNGKADRT